MKRLLFFTLISVLAGNATASQQPQTKSAVDSATTSAMSSASATMSASAKVSASALPAATVPAMSPAPSNTVPEELRKFYTDKALALKVFKEAYNQTHLAVEIATATVEVGLRASDEQDASDCQNVSSIAESWGIAIFQGLFGYTAKNPKIASAVVAIIAREHEFIKYSN